MLKTIRRGLSKDEGFTLIELMVVVMIIAVLIAIAIPSFLGFRKSAQDRSAQSEIRSVLLSEKAFWLDNGTYTETITDITAFEPNASMDAADPTVGVVAQLASDTDIVCLTRTADSGNTFAVWESSSGGTFYGETDLSVTCPLAAARPATYVQGGW